LLVYDVAQIVQELRCSSSLLIYFIVKGKTCLIFLIGMDTNFIFFQTKVYLESLVISIYEKEKKLQSSGFHPIRKPCNNV
jgi:hypothetical protein